LTYEATPPGSFLSSRSALSSTKFTFSIFVFKSEFDYLKLRQARVNENFFEIERKADSKSVTKTTLKISLVFNVFEMNSGD